MAKGSSGSGADGRVPTFTEPLAGSVWSHVLATSPGF